MKLNCLYLSSLLFPFIASVGESPGLCAFLLTVVSVILIFATVPFSLFLCVKVSIPSPIPLLYQIDHESRKQSLPHQVVQEYERAVIFRLGRLLRGGAKGPGIFFIIPCIDSYCKVDLRTVSFDVPPQEVTHHYRCFHC